MGTETLLHLGDGLGQKANFQFDHAMSHRRIMGEMAPLTTFSAIPYFIDPLVNEAAWHMDHQQAHNDFTVTIPVWFGWEVAGTIAPPQNVIDTNLDTPEKKTWWLFANHQTHFTAESVLSTESVFPFW